MAKTSNVLTEEFLMDLYKTCMDDEYVLAIVCANMHKEYLPDRDFISLHRSLCNYYNEYRNCPSYSVIKQSLSNSRGAMNLFDDIWETSNGLKQDEAVEQVELYIKQVRFQKAFKESGEAYNSQEFNKAASILSEYTTWLASFSLRSTEYIDIIGSFQSRFTENRARHNASNKLRPITRFYIDDLDVMNQNQDLRTQLTCILAPTGVGKSHAARWIGKNAAQIDGFNVLHFQLEGSRDEVANAYSASLVSCSSYRYSTGTLRDVDVNKMIEMLKAISGKLYVKSYPKFNARVSTIDIRNGIQNFKKLYGIDPDIVIIDSMDLLTDSSGRKWGENAERHKRISVANDLKDLAVDENVWMVATYQSTIENKEWLNDEKNVLTEYNTAEAKGLSRPLTHLITLNQSDRERKEHTMRIHVAKSRFFEKGETVKIATDFENEMFYDSVRTLNINKMN